MNFLNNLIYIHPLTIPVLILLSQTSLKHRFITLYIFILLHELSHAAVCLVLKEKISSVRLLPTGCVLSLKTTPDKSSSLLIFIAGPLFNIIMYLLGIFPTENISLALFNLIPVMPLDGGCIISTLFPKHFFHISLIFIFLLFAASAYFRVFPTLPVILLLILIIGEKSRLDKTIDIKIMRYFKLNK